MAGNSAEPGRTVTGKVATILTVLTTGRGHTVSSVARQAQLPVSTVHRLLSDCVTSLLVERMDCAEYRLGPLLRSLQSDAARPTVFSRAPLVADDLSAALRRTVRLGVLDGCRVMYIEKVPGPFPGTTFPNAARLPVHATAIGKALVAFAPNSLFNQLVVAGLPSYTSRTLTAETQLSREFSRTRARGFATADCELDGFTSAIAAPVFDAVGDPVAAVEVQVAELGAESLSNVVPALLVAARAMSRELAGVGPLRDAGGLRMAAGFRRVGETR